MDTKSIRVKNSKKIFSLVAFPLNFNVSVYLMSENMFLNNTPLIVLCNGCTVIWI